MTTGSENGRYSKGFLVAVVVKYVLRARRLILRFERTEMNMAIFCSSGLARRLGLDINTMNMDIQDRRPSA